MKPRLSDQTIRSTIADHLSSRVLPTTLLPLHLLSLPSLLSTLSSLLLVLVLLLDGFLKSSPPGSILHPGPTNWTPEWNSGNFLGGVGLVLAGFGGHAVVPGLARDMKYPECFDKVINRAFVSQYWRSRCVNARARVGSEGNRDSKLIRGF